MANERVLLSGDDAMNQLPRICFDSAGPGFGSIRTLRLANGARGTRFSPDRQKASAACDPFPPLGAPRCRDLWLIVDLPRAERCLQVIAEIAMGVPTSWSPQLQFQTIAGPNGRVRWTDMGPLIIGRVLAIRLRYRRRGEFPHRRRGEFPRQLGSAGVHMRASRGPALSAQAQKTAAAR